MARPHVVVGTDHYGGMSPIKCYQITVTNTATALPALLGEAVAAGAHLIWLDPEGDIRVTFGDQTPHASTLGIRFPDAVRQEFQCSKALLDGMKLIAGGNTKVNIHLFF